MNLDRVRSLNGKNYKSGGIVYWMSRDQRASDNWALHYALSLAQEHHTALSVVFCLRKSFPHNTQRLVDFMLNGLEEVEQDLAKKHIPFHFLLGDPSEEIPAFLAKNHGGALVSDFNPLRWHRKWQEQIAEKIEMPFYEVDAHNIIPVWIASPKQEFGAYTIRPKIHAHFQEFLTPYPELSQLPGSFTFHATNWGHVRKQLKTDDSVPAVNWLKPGQKAAQEMLNEFIEQRLKQYDKDRNDPTKDGQSMLSPYLHFGHISAQTVALHINETRVALPVKEAFLEELIVRRELSDNYCYYNEKYDSPEGFPSWARQTIQKHAADAREFLYSRDELEQAKTHDPLWNAAQKQMVNKGKMHGYMRMYWAKKILEWTRNVSEAQSFAIYLNDKYFLDGRDPNGYTGIAWSLGGVHDRAWFERPIFGKIRYMNYNGAKSKFDIQKYIEQNL